VSPQAGDDTVVSHAGIAHKETSRNKVATVTWKGVPISERLETWSMTSMEFLNPE